MGTSLISLSNTYNFEITTLRSIFYPDVVTSGDVLCTLLQMSSKVQKSYAQKESQQEDWSVVRKKTKKSGLFSLTADGYKERRIA
jgi:hypothetical protein